MELEVTRKIASKFWWAYTWRTVPLVIFVALIPLGVAQFFPEPTEGSTILFSLIPLLQLFILIFVQISIMKSVLKKKFKGFRVVILSEEPEGAKENA